MNSKGKLISVAVTISLAVVFSLAISAANQDRYTLKVPGGLAFAEFRGYENWQVIAVSQNRTVISAILGNPEIIKAFESGIPGNGKPFPEGAKMVKIHWTAKKAEMEIGQPLVPDTLNNVEFMEKDNKRFTDSHGWGYGVFYYEASSQTFRVGNLQDTPPQANDAKCGAACHEAAKDTNYVFTRFPPR